jgi:hypothetical protein
MEYFRLLLLWSESLIFDLWLELEMLLLKLTFRSFSSIMSSSYSIFLSFELISLTSDSFYCYFYEICLNSSCSTAYCLFFISRS